MGVYGTERGCEGMVQGRRWKALRGGEGRTALQRSPVDSNRVSDRNRAFYHCIRILACYYCIQVNSDSAK